MHQRLYGVVDDYGILGNETARMWQERFRGALADDGDEVNGGKDGSGSTWSAEQLIGDERLRTTIAAAMRTRMAELVLLAGSDEIALQVLGVLCLAAGVPMPDDMKARVLEALDREIAYDIDEEEFSGWDHWSMRVGILRVVRDMVERNDGMPVYAGNQTLWAQSDNSDLDGFLLTPIGRLATNPPRSVYARQCNYGEISDNEAVPPATLVVVLGHEKPTPPYALLTIEAPVRQIWGPQMRDAEIEEIACWITANRDPLLAHWRGKLDSVALLRAVGVWDHPLHRLKSIREAEPDCDSGKRKTDDQ